MEISVIIRTFNEERYLDELLAGIARQCVVNQRVEVIVIDSGSSDRTIEIAQRYGCTIKSIAKRDFTFGRSLNIGCEAARGDILVFVSGHCVPASDGWLDRLIAPIREGAATYSYGRQVGRDTTKFSESQVLERYFPASGCVVTSEFFCNNANAAVLRSAWELIRFDELLTGLEDLRMAKDLVYRGYKIKYVADAPVYHIHNESWRQVRLRYERESLALREIMPEVHVSFSDFLRYFSGGVINDFFAARRQRCLLGSMKEIVLFRFMQFWGTYRGNREHRQVSARKREEYFYPVKLRKPESAKKPDRTVAAESP